MMEKLTKQITSVSLWIFIGLLAYIPFHIFLSTWIGSSFSILDAAKITKDVLLVIGFLLALCVSVRKPWFKELLKDKLVLLILAYAALTVLLALLKPTDQDAEILGIVYNTRFFVFFLYGLLLSRLLPQNKIKWLAIKTALISGSVVVLFGILQYLVLPDTALQQVGYTRDNGVLPAFFIDDKPDLERVMSTLRDPNSLGSYLIIVASVALAILLSTKRALTRRLLIGYYGLILLCLALTFSRSALLGFMLSAVFFIAMTESKFRRVLVKRQKMIPMVAVVAVLAGAIGLFALKDSYVVQNVVFHADESTTLESPNQLRIRFWQESIFAAMLQPDGSGPGTAGLASIKNDVQGTVLNENYYLQILTEVGVLGLLLFMAILVVVTIRLFQARTSLFTLALLGSFLGLAFTNLLVHIWSNEAVAYTWWGLAGLALSQRPVLKTKSVSKYFRLKKRSNLPS